MSVEQIATYLAFAIAIASALTTIVPADTRGGVVLKAIKAVLDALALNFGHAANGLPDSVQAKKPE